MDTLVIQLINQKAYKLLEDMEDLGLIKILGKTENIPQTTGQIKTSMDNGETGEQLN